MSVIIINEKELAIERWKLANLIGQIKRFIDQYDNNAEILIKLYGSILNTINER